MIREEIREEILEEPTIELVHIDLGQEVLTSSCTDGVSDDSGEWE